MVVAHLPNAALKDSRASDRLGDYPELVGSIRRFADAMWHIPAVLRVIATLDRGEVYVVTMAMRTDDASYARIYGLEYQLERENPDVYWNFRVSSAEGQTESDGLSDSALVFDRPANQKH